MKKINTSFITTSSEDFKQAIEIRYSQLFKEKNLPKSITVDDLDNTSLHCIAKHNQEVIGYGRLFIDGNKGKISQMAVQKEWQTKGVGKQTVLAIIEKAKQENLSHLYMSARTHVIGFYEKIGFQVKEEEGTYPSKITKIPHKTMVMDLNEK